MNPEPSLLSGMIFYLCMI